MATDRATETLAINMTVAGNSVLMDYRNLTDVMLTELAHEVAKDPNRWLDKFRDIVVLQQAEARGFQVEGASVGEALDDIYAEIGHPVLTMTPTDASNHGKKASELAYDSMTTADKATHDAFAERKATRAATRNGQAQAAMTQVQPLSATGTPIHDQMQAGQNGG